MTTLQLASLALLVAMFALTVWRKVNIGFIALPAAYVLSQVAGIPEKAFLSAFPVKLVMLIIGVTLLFAHVDRSGLLEHAIRKAMRHGGHRTWVAAGVCFVVPAALTAAGAYGPASAAIIMPLAYKLSKQANINYFLLGTATIFGAIGATFSPVSASGALIKSLAAKASLHYSTGVLFVLPLLGALVITAVTMVVIQLRESRTAAKPRALVPSGAGADHGTGSAPRPDSPRLSAYEVACLCGVVAMLVAVFGFDLDVGFVSLGVSLLLFLVFRPPERELINAIPWQVVFLIGGLLMYIGVLTSIGTLGAMAKVLSDIGTPVFTLLVLAYLCALMSNVESAAILVLGILVPVALAVFGGSPVTLAAALVVVALCAAAPALNPVHIGGALILANGDPAHEAPTFRKLLWHAIGTTVVVPGLATLAAVPFIA